MGATILRVLIVLLLVWIGYLVAANLERHTEVVDNGPSPEVQRNRYYAAGAFLEQRGLGVDHSRYPVNPEALAAQDTLLLTDTEYLANDPEAVHQLLLWVRSGGHLIWPYTSELEAQPLAEALGIQLERKQSDEAQGKQLNRSKATVSDQETSTVSEPTPDEFSEDKTRANQASETEAADVSARERVRVNIRQREADIQQEQLSRFAPLGAPNMLIHQAGSTSLSPTLAEPGEGIYPTVEAVSRSGNGVDMLLLSLGQGEVTVLKDVSIWSNYDIGLFDHAHLLGWLTRNSARVHIQRYSQWPPLSQLIWTYAPEALLAGSALLLGWLLHLGRRFGPIRRPGLQQRRSLGEHVEAVARFHYQYGQVDYLLAPLRRQITQRAARLQLGFERLSPERQCEAITRLATLQPEEATQALMPREHYNATELVDTVQLLIRIRNRL